MRDLKEIELEITTLKEMKPKVRRSSAFGDDHHAAIDAQIDVLQNNHSEDWIWGQADEPADSGYVDNVRDSALDAARWRSGDEDTKPSEGWKELVIN
jgi:hypothetical protein